ncbi:hypothetical protein B0H17DRAFT_1151174 [Mycena rosella]|uniref:Uncharacterized protein n=1 Tax=Mycena rosella TaxID=1033263 RepID=A0AAD7FKD9_MYCRO|nr:hypothetical protein B0H17DRAFT_1151174 [Mycena rosella]
MPTPTPIPPANAANKANSHRLLELNLGTLHAAHFRTLARTGAGVGDMFAKDGIRGGSAGVACLGGMSSNEGGQNGAERLRGKDGEKGECYMDFQRAFGRGRLELGVWSVDLSGVERGFGEWNASCMPCRVSIGVGGVRYTRRACRMSANDKSSTASPGFDSPPAHLATAKPFSVSRNRLMR